MISPRTSGTVRVEFAVLLDVDTVKDDSVGLGTAEMLAVSVLLTTVLEMLVVGRTAAVGVVVTLLVGIKLVLFSTAGVVNTTETVATADELSDDFWEDTMIEEIRSRRNLRRNILSVAS